MSFLHKLKIMKLSEVIKIKKNEGKNIVTQKLMKQKYTYENIDIKTGTPHLYLCFLIYYEKI